MRFSVKTDDIRKALSGAETQIAKAVTAGMRDASAGLKDDLRDGVRGAGLGQRLANTWRGKSYPESGESVEAAAFVWSKAPKLIDAYDRGVTISARGRRFLAIPTPEAGVRHATSARRRGTTGHTLTPAVWERETGIKLRWVPGRGGGVLVADAFYMRQPARWRRRKSFQPIKTSGPRPGRKFIVIFVLVAQVRVQKRLDIDGIAKAWADRVPGLIARHWT
ncbi:DUF6441 family protein [Enterovirga sp. CN4-39]|uniref:DUF6441 family protein n=1 Tax=Enterovirga sp. CN4-39 TaxID=3400910 RepID=UPI003C05CFBB